MKRIEELEKKLLIMRDNLKNIILMNKSLVEENLRLENELKSKKNKIKHLHEKKDALILDRNRLTEENERLFNECAEFQGKLSKEEKEKSELKRLKEELEKANRVLRSENYRNEQQEKEYNSNKELLKELESAGVIQLYKFIKLNAINEVNNSRIYTNGKEGSILFKNNFCPSCKSTKIKTLFGTKENRGCETCGHFFNI